jgi:hypothetical protein
MDIDQALGVMHIVYYTYLSTSSVEWKHITIDVTVDPPSIVSTTSIIVETGWYGSYVPRDGVGVAAGILHTHDRPTAEITATAYDAVRNVMTVTYYLYDDSSDNVNIQVATDYGTGWFEATRKGTEGEGKTGLSTSPAGEVHTFVHDLGADGSPLINRIQYKITATQP